MLEYLKLHIQRQPSYRPWESGRAHPCTHISTLIDPHRLDTDRDLHIIPDQLRAG
ncbi:MAG: hypothetical protein QOH59_1233, partial [Gemmatimonadales bacterium]|nr:hypothetical protein [Gemmatimonadales bacterium]